MEVAAEGPGQGGGLDWAGSSGHIGSVRSRLCKPRGAQEGAVRLPCEAPWAREGMSPVRRCLCSLRGPAE